MKEWVDVHVFNHPWNLMVEAAFRKYPNPHSTSVKSLDTLERKATAKRLFSHRFFYTMWSIPDIALKILGSNPVMIVNEQSECDLESKTLTICARNITLLNFFVLNEKLEYSVSEDDPTKTVLRQTARMHIHGVPLFGSILERVWIGQYESTISKGRLGIESVAQKIIAEKQLTDHPT